MEFRTKRDAEEAATELEQRAQRSREALDVCGHREARFNLGRMAEEQESEAARIRALLPNLPEEA